MEVFRVREGKLPLVVGIADTVFFSLLLGVSVYISISDEDWTTMVVCALIFGFFTLLGIYLILDYSRRKLILFTSHISYTPAVGRTRTYYYHEVDFIRSRAEHLDFYSHSGKKLLSIEINMLGWVEALYYLYEKGIEVEEKKIPGKPFWPERWKVPPKNGYIQQRWSRKRIDRERKAALVLGRLLTVCALGSLLLPVRWRLLVCIAVLLIEYFMYLFLYPKMILEDKKNCDEFHIILPKWPVIVGGLLLLFFDEDMNMEDGVYFLHTAVLTGILLIPYFLVLAARKIKEHPLVCLLVAVVSFMLAAMLVPSVNYAATFEKPAHEWVTVLEKDMSRGSKGGADYYIRYMRNGKRQRASVSLGVYDSVSEGDQVRLCLRESIFGMKYWLVHQ